MIKINQNNPTDILKSAKNLYEKIYTKEATSKAALLNFLEKSLIERKNLMNNLTFMSLKYL